MNVLVCKICESTFTAKRSDTKYCSEKCRTRNETIQRQKKVESSRVIPIKKCKVCEKDFKPHVRNPHQIYCGETCLNKAMSQRAVESGRKKEQYLKHKEKYAEQKSKTDLDYKDRIRFGGNKYKVLERDGHKCAECGNDNKLNLVIHHIDHSGQTDNPNNEMSNLVTLCNSCHMRYHQTLRRAEQRKAKEG